VRTRIGQAAVVKLLKPQQPRSVFLRFSGKAAAGNSGCNLRARETPSAGWRRRAVQGRCDETPCGNLHVARQHNAAREPKTRAIPAVALSPGR